MVSMQFKPDTDMPVDQALRLYLQGKIRVLKEVAIHLADSDRSMVVESVHDLRVICRQILSAFDAFGPWVCMRRLKPLKREIRAVNRLLGPVRDLDVLLEQPDLPSPNREKAEHDRRYALSCLITECTGRKLIDRVSRMGGPLAISNTKNPSGFKSAANGQVPIQTLGPVIPEILYRLAAEITVFRSILGSQSPPPLPDDLSVSSQNLDRSIHQLRIACKRFRYTLAFLRPLFSTEADEALRSFKELQDLLGTWHDLYLLIRTVEDQSDSATASLESVKKHQAELLVSFDAVWQTLDEAWFHRLIRLLVDSMYATRGIDHEELSS